MNASDHRQRERRTRSAQGSQRAAPRQPEPPETAAGIAPSILRLHAGAGNAAVSRWLARQPSGTKSRAGRGSGASLGNRIALLGAGLTQSIVKTTVEVPPAGGHPSYAGHGYAIEAEAVIDAQRHADAHVLVTVVVVDAAGRFHVFETDATLVSSIAIRMAFVKHVCQPSAAAQQSWRRRKERALAAVERRDYDPVRTLITEVTGLDDVHVAFGRAPHTVAPANARPRGVVNFDPSFGLSGRTFNGPERAEPMGELPEPVFVIGRDALASPETLRSTVAHEARHAHLHRRVVGLIEDWRGAGAKPGFHVWLRKHKAAIPKEVYWAAEALAGGSGGADTELFTSVETVIDLLDHAQLATLADPMSKEAIDLLMNLQAFVGAHLTAGSAPAAAALARLTAAILAAADERAKALCAILRRHPAALYQPYGDRFRPRIDTLVAKIKTAAGC